MSKNNLEIIWNRVRTPNPRYVKEFNRGGGFRGSSTNSQYATEQATLLFGPNGAGWGVEITHEDYVTGSPIFSADKETVLCNTVVHVVRGYVWYMHEGERKQTSTQFGQTTFVGSNKYGPFTDEEAPKKSVTDLMLKCLSLLGFSADIFLGLWDDSKYVNDARAHFEKLAKEEQQKQQQQPQGYNSANFFKELSICQSPAEIEKLLKSPNATKWDKTLSPENKKIVDSKVNERTKQVTTEALT